MVRLRVYKMEADVLIHFWYLMSKTVVCWAFDTKELVTQRTLVSFSLRGHPKAFLQAGPAHCI
mgnify:CR=1 FL=1